MSTAAANLTSAAVNITATGNLTPEDNSGDLMIARVVIIVIMLLSSSFVFLPFTKRCEYNKSESKSSGKNLFFAVSACFAAGMLMSISILHILPEATEMYEGVTAKWAAEAEVREAAEALAHGETAEAHADDDDHAGEGGHGFPLPFFIFQAGFFIMLTMNLIF